MPDTVQQDLLVAKLKLLGVEADIASHAAALCAKGYKSKAALYSGLSKIKSLLIDVSTLTHTLYEDPNICQHCRRPLEDHHPVWKDGLPSPVFYCDEESVAEFVPPPQPSRGQAPACKDCGVFLLPVRDPTQHPTGTKRHPPSTCQRNDDYVATEDIVFMEDNRV